MTSNTPIKKELLVKVEPKELKEKIDSLEKDYHDAGCEVIQATKKLNEGMFLILTYVIYYCIWIHDREKE